VGHLADGRVVFVPLSAPGDLVRVRIAEESRRFARAEIEAIVEPGVGRTAPECRHFGDCGGCSWQHVEYSVQLAAKAAILREALQRIGGCELEAGAVEMTASPRAFGYRGRTRVLEREGRIGYRARGSHRLCAVGSCPVLSEPVAAELVRLTRERATAAGVEDSQGSAEWEIGAGSDGRARSARLGESSRGAPQIAIEVPGETLRISPGTFFQANVLLLDQLVSSVLAATGEGALLIELFAGAGLFTLPLARHFAHVVAVEGSPGAAADLRANLESAKLASVEVHETSVEAWLSEHSGSPPDAVLLDPPRSGLPPTAVDGLVRLEAPRIAYLSCDPATLARDVARLRAAGYGVKAIRGFDLFPQTPHVEALVRLERDGA
jgi:23S rRNA (uracil1939-C5)-methyltransferase